MRIWTYFERFPDSAYRIIRFWILTPERNYARAVRGFCAALLLGPSGCGVGGGSAIQTYDQFMATLRLTPPLQAIGATDIPPQRRCSSLPDDAPYTQTIQAALDMVANEVDRAFHDEAMAFLDGGVVYRELNTDKVFPYSAFYSRRTILLYDKLFDYGCLEDVVSTLVHELVHAVQQSRFQRPGTQRGEYSLVGQNRKKTLAELEADAYQIHVSKSLGLLGPAHAGRVIAVNNARRQQFNAQSVGSG